LRVVMRLRLFKVSSLALVLVLMVMQILVLRRWMMFGTLIYVVVMITGIFHFLVVIVDGRWIAMAIA